MRNLLLTSFIVEVGETAIKYFDLFLKGLGITLILSIVTVLGGVVFGTIICFMKIGSNKILSTLAKIYIDVIRGIPLLLQLYIIVLLLPVGIDEFYGVCIGLIINSSAYVAELVRAGIQSVDKGQTEAARSLGLSNSQTMRKVVLPQAVKNILPSLGNEFVMVIKETSLASVFYVGELMTVKKTITAITYKSLEPFIVIAIIYFVLTTTLSKIITKFERKLSG